MGAIDEFRPAPLVLADLNEKFDLDWGVIAAVGGVSRAALRKWREGSSRPERARWIRLVRLAGLCEALTTVETDASAWLSGPLDGDPVLKVYDLARVDRFDLLRELFHRRLRADQARLAAFPSVVQPGRFEANVVWSGKGVLVRLPDFGIAVDAATLTEAEEECADILMSFLDDPDSPEREQFPWLIELDRKALKAALFGR